jgi:hypothetical protein
MEKGRHAEEYLRRAKSTLAVAYQNAWEKLQKYYNLTDRSHQIYAAALLLHPEHRKRYFDTHWIEGEAPKWNEVMINPVREVWKTQYKINPPQNDIITSTGQPPTFVDDYLRRYRVIDDQV